MKLSEIYSKCAELGEKHGLIAGHRGDPASGFCALGLIEYAIFGRFSLLNDSTLMKEAETALASILNLQRQGDRYNYGGDSPEFKVAAWSNNLVDAGKGSEVIAGFRKAAELAAAEGK